MIGGIFLRHYKCYENMNFIPFIDDLSHKDDLDTKYSVFVGDNGVGKSAILEALDTYFNNREWNITRKTKRDDAFIVPIFLLEKDDPLVKELNTLEKIKKISDCFYEYDHKSVKEEKAIEELIRFKDQVKKRDKYYFLPLGINYKNKNKVSFGSRDFENIIDEMFIDEIFPNDDKLKNKSLEELDSNEKEKVKKKRKKVCKERDKVLGKIKEDIFNLYKYVYIPVEQDMKEVLRVENLNMQVLMGKDIVKEIEEVLKKKVEVDGGKKQIINYINEHLKKLLEEVNSNLEKEDSNYEYKSKSSHKKSLTENDIKDQIVDAYFSLQELSKDGISIDELSSGEKRRAMIDTVSALLSSNTDREQKQKTILAIDEPENSMHVSRCFSQFEKLEELSLKYGHQVLITTHWYGFLPVSKSGSMIYIHIKETNKDGKKLRSRKIDTFSLDNAIEQTANERLIVPDFLKFKSTFDLTSSMLSYLDSCNNIKWIICEGISDQRYLEAMLNSEDIKITSIGGAEQLKNLYYHMYLPIEERIENFKKKGNKIIFLTDVDDVIVNFYKPDRNKKNNEINKIISLRVLQNKNGEIELKDIFRTRDRLDKTEIEDCLVPKIFYDSIMELFPEYKEDFIFNNEAKVSQIEGDESILTPKNENYHKRKRKLLEELNDKKVKLDLCDTYVRKYKEEKIELKDQLKEELIKVFN